MVEILNSVIWGFAALGFFLLIGFIYWIDSKKPSKKRDPITKAIILSGFLMAVMFTAEAVGYLEKGWNSENFWVHILLVMSMISMFLFIANRKKPLSYEKQKRIAKTYIAQEYYGKDYVGTADVPWLLVYKLTVDGQQEDTRGEIGNFLVEIKAASLFKIWVQINVYTGQLLHLQSNPPSRLSHELLDKDSPKKDQFGKEFEGEEEKPDAAAGTPSRL